MRSMRSYWALLLLLTVGLIGCGEPKESTEQKLAAFQKAQHAIYDAWQANTTTELQDLLSTGLTEPLLSQQFNQQTKVMQQRTMLNERHSVKQITFHKLDMVTDGSTDFTVYAEWTVDGLIEHGDVHEMKVSYKKKFHVVKQKDGLWKIDRMMD